MVLLIAVALTMNIFLSMIEVNFTKVVGGPQLCKCFSLIVSNPTVPLTLGSMCPDNSLTKSKSASHGMRLSCRQVLITLLMIMFKFFS